MGTVSFWVPVEITDEMRTFVSGTALIRQRPVLREPADQRPPSKVRRFQRVVRPVSETLRARGDRPFQNEAVACRNNHQLRSVFETKLLPETTRDGCLSLRGNRRHFGIIRAHST